ncbi:TPA: hypothetical protein DF272_00430 [Candidatus Falkowbacteria bacterium]|nr:hypothetical protein [Candidatus Falkowbacteria bacterium]
MPTTQSPSPKIHQSIYFLLLSNLLPLAGVLFWDWNVGSILLLYWIENIIIGLFNIPRMIKKPLGKSRDKYVSDSTVKTFIIVFFILHYGLFCLSHYYFISLIMEFARTKIEFANIFFPVAALIVSHGLSYFNNFIKNREYLRGSIQKQMKAPYSRVLATTFVVVFGGTVSFFLAEPLTALVALVIIKTIFDLRAHKRVHQFN